MADEKPMTLEDKLGLLTYKNDHKSHIKVMEADVCLKCPNKPCVTGCPAGVYSWMKRRRRFSSLMKTVSNAARPECCALTTILNGIRRAGDLE